MSRPAPLLLRHRGRRGDAHGGMPALHPGFAFREASVGREPRDRVEPVDPPGDVQQDDRAGRHGMVSGGRGHHAGGARHGAGLPDPNRVERVVAVEDPHVRSVRADRPELLVVDGVPVDVIPAGVDDASVVQHGRIPLVGLVKGDHPRIGAVGIGHGHRVDGAGPPPTAVKAAPARGEEEDFSIGEVAG